MKLAEALVIVQKASADGTPFPVLLGCGFTPLHLQTFLAAHLNVLYAQQGVSKSAKVITGLYGSLAETLERLSSFECEAGAVFVEWADLDPRLGYRNLGGWGNALRTGVIAAVQTNLARLAEAIGRRPPYFKLVLSLPTLPMTPGFHTVGWQASAAEIALENALSSFAEQLALEPSVLVLNRQKLNAASPPGERYDFRSDVNAGFPYKLKHADVVAEAAANLLALQPPKKGLISDLDDTMWRGIVGEEGPDGVAWDLAGGAQIHGLYQQMLQSLAEHGVLIGIASKNDRQTAERALMRSDMALPRDKIFPAEIHWQAKSGSVNRILQTWNIGADSVVFVDDSPMELEQVRSAHPNMECIEFPKGDYAKAFALLQRLRDLFGKPALSAEDALRLESIRNGQQFLKDSGGADLAEQFLASAEATVTFELDPAAEDARVLELVNKTNQFNLNGTRFTEADWRRNVLTPGAFVVSVSYQDKFGPLGKISVVSGIEHEDTVTIHTWVLSCRAFSRRIEHQILQQVFEKTGLARVCFAYIPTPKNGPIRDFLRSIMGSDWEGGPVITRQAFADNCPKLYHQVAFNSKDKESSSWTTQKSV